MTVNTSCVSIKEAAVKRLSMLHVHTRSTGVIWATDEEQQESSSIGTDLVTPKSVHCSSASTSQHLLFCFIVLNIYVWQSAYILLQRDLLV